MLQGRHEQGKMSQSSNFLQSQRVEETECKVKCSLDTMGTVLRLCKGVGAGGVN